MEPKNLSPSSGLRSHPEKLLEQHLLGAYRWASTFLRNGPNITNNQEIQDAILLASLFHDIGKATKYFQEQLQNPETFKDFELAKHSLFSAIFTLYALEKKYMQNGTNLTSLTPFFAYTAVRKHHGDLVNLYALASDVTKDDDEIILKQAKSIEKEKFELLLKILKSEAHIINDLDVELDDFILWLQKGERDRLFRRFRSALRDLDEENNTRHYLEMSLIYSTVTDSDLLDIFLGSEPCESTSTLLCSEIIERYILENLEKKKTEINLLRAQAFREVKSKAIDPSNRLYLLNLPTGIGKTLISLHFALRIRDTLGKNLRIIYALPFLSIIDQNHHVFEQVLEFNSINPTLEILLKHHHLSDLYYDSDERYGDLSSEYKKFQIESWNSEIVVTTFVQFFHTIFSNKKRMLRRFNRLANSIIILDEIQAIPVKYWDLIKNTLTELAENLNIYVILSTATTPLIFDMESQNLTRLCEPKSYYLNLNRVKMRIDPENRTLEEFKTSYVDLLKENGGLIILNTIGCAVEFYQLIKDITKKRSTFLSTHIIPKTRRERIEKIRDGQFHLVVTTQLVEAGVDIDFPFVIRDIAPLDSIIQSAGRCNRNGLGLGRFFVIHLIDKNNRLFADYVYDRILIEATKEILEKKAEYEEKDFPELIEKYYNCVRSRKSQDLSKALLDAMIRLNYASEHEGISIKDFKLIEDDVPKVSVFLEYDEEAMEIGKFLKEKVMPEKDPLEKRRLFDRIKGSFYDYLINVPKNCKNLPEYVGELDLYYVRRDELELYYDHETGYKVKEDGITTLCA